MRGHRLTGSTTVCAPCGSAQAATWDRELVGRLGRMLGDQARAKQVHVLLAPTINLHRHPLGGRNFESYSEDPYLTAQLAVAYIRGVQSRRVAATAKHFVANDQEHDRLEVSVEVDERTLHEMYLQPFEAAVREGGVWAVMAAYNRLNGVHCSEHDGLLDGILRHDWGFDGLVMSDWYATHSTAAVAAGLDLEMPGPPQYLGPYLAAAVHQGDLPEAVLDRAANRLLTLVERVTGPAGDGDGEGDGAGAPQSAEDPIELSRAVARDGIVLLRNNGTLPLRPERVHSIAVLGPNADRPDIQGGGSSHTHPENAVTPLAGIADRAGPIEVRHEPGVVEVASGPLGRRELTVPGSRDADGPGDPGIRVEYFAGADLDGTPQFSEVASDTELYWIGPPVPGHVEGQFSVRATADFVPDRSGPWRLRVTSAGAARVLVDGRVVVDNLQPEPGTSFFGRGSRPVDGEAELAAGTSYRVVIELHSRPVPAGGAPLISGVMVHARPPEDPEAPSRAVAAAAAADVVVVVVGTDKPDTEGSDRLDMDLPAGQNELVRAAVAANPATVVVLNTGSPVAMPWVEDVAALAQLWYPGQEGGTALADVLFGDSEPSGRLPVTFPRRLEDTPAYPTYPGQHGRAPYNEGVFVGYRHYDAHHVDPLFCFGHGLSYTRFDYGPAVVEMDPAGQHVAVAVDVTNVGDRWGREVVQVYVRDVEASVSRPERELKQFAKVGLEPGETRTVRLELSRRAFAFWDVIRHDWLVEPGTFELAVGSSSRDIRSTARLELEALEPL